MPVARWPRQNQESFTHAQSIAPIVSGGKGPVLALPVAASKFVLTIWGAEGAIDCEWVKDS